MTILVDEVRNYPNTRLPYKNWSHLTCDDGDLAALHKFAVEVLGLKREWFQDHSTAPHYDITPNKRDLALRHGAVFVPAVKQAEARIARWRVSKWKGVI